MLSVTFHPVRPAVMIRKIVAKKIDSTIDSR